MIIYNGFQIPETVQEITLCSRYGYSYPCLQISSVDGNIKFGTIITIEDINKPDFSMSEAIEICKRSIDKYNAAINDSEKKG